MCYVLQQYKMEWVANPKMSVQEAKFGLEGFYMTVQSMNQLILAIKFQIQLVQAGCQIHQKKKDHEHSHNWQDLTHRKVKISLLRS